MKSGFKITQGGAILLTVALLDAALFFTGSYPLLTRILTSGLVVWTVAALLRLATGKTKFMWRLRNRLLIVYAFIALVPTLLVLSLTACAAYIVAGQVASHLVTSEFERRAALFQRPAQYLSRVPPAAWTPVAGEIAPALALSFPGFEIVSSTSKQLFRYPLDSNAQLPSADTPEISGTIYEAGNYFCIALSANGENRTMIRAAITPEFLASLVPGIGVVRVANGTPAGVLPPAWNALDLPVAWYSPLTVRTTRGEPFPAQLQVDTRISAVLGVVFANYDAATTWLMAFLLLVGVLGAVELASVLLGVSMTRTITGAVHNLYEGTVRIGEGDLAHRIAVTGNDQLSDLGHSFNRMTAHLEDLVDVAREKERLQSELTIAGEVQDQLFPRKLPTLRTIELSGDCEPARMVSGDYYDYACLPDEKGLAITIGDVAGKGISAALLMASIQSIMRTQFVTGIPSISGAVAQLNRQLYATTAPEKYTTFFFGVYDENTRRLTYTNAGHLPPIIVRGDKLELLEVTGSVVGAFPSLKYEEQSVIINSGDILVGYTDGITEPENEYGEEFGVERLAEIVIRNSKGHAGDIAAQILAAVRAWSKAPELPDDMTILLARGL